MFTGLGQVFRLMHNLLISKTFLTTSQCLKASSELFTTSNGQLGHYFLTSFALSLTPVGTGQKKSGVAVGLPALAYISATA